MVENSARYVEALLLTGDIQASYANDRKEKLLMKHQKEIHCLGSAQLRLLRL
jgi:hypothetical protein